MILVVLSPYFFFPIEKIGMSLIQSVAFRCSHMDNRIDTFHATFDLQFAAIGAYDNNHRGILLKDSQSTYKFYASGRRHCVGLLATMEVLPFVLVWSDRSGFVLIMLSLALQTP